MPRELVCTGPRRVEFREYEERDLNEGEVRLKTLRTAISHGTEMAFYRGTTPFAEKRFDTDLRLFLPAEAKSEGPLRLGYECTGRVTEVGAGVDSLKPGDLVFAPLGHRETQTISAKAVNKLPSGVDEEAGLFLPLGSVAFHAIHDAQVKVGDEVAVFGLGTIGLLAIQVARLQGAARVTAVDPIASRRQVAEKTGADVAYDPTACDAAYEIKRTSPRKGCDSAIEAAGSYPALHEAIRSVRMAGVVVTVSYFQGEAKGLRLGEEWHHNRVTLRSSMGVWGCPHRYHPLWDRPRVIDLIVDLLDQGRLETASLVSHRMPFEQMAEAYRLVDEEPHKTTKMTITYGE